MGDLRSEFSDEMRAFARESQRVLGYPPRRTLNMMHDLGCLEAARQLIQMPYTEGLADLTLKERLDISVEALVLQNRFRPLFSTDELRQADKTLRDHGFTFPPGYVAP